MNNYNLEVQKEITTYLREIENELELKRKEYENVLSRYEILLKNLNKVLKEG